MLSNIFKSNINRINEDVESFCVVKSKIENMLIEKNKLEKKQTIQDYLSNIGLEKNIMMLNDKENTVIAFNVFKTNIGEYAIVYSYDGTDEEKEQKLFKALENLRYDLTNLKKISQIEMINGATKGRYYFIINNEFYID